MKFLKKYFFWLDDIVYVSILTVNVRNHPYMMKIIQKKLVNFSIFLIFRWYLYKKTLKNNFLDKKSARQSSVMPKIWFLFARTWIKKKKNHKKILIFFLISYFLGSKKVTPKSKIRKNGSVQHLKIHLRLYSEKMGKFEFWEPKNLWYTTSTFILFDYFPEEPVSNARFCLRVNIAQLGP